MDQIFLKLLLNRVYLRKLKQLFNTLILQNNRKNLIIMKLCTYFTYRSTGITNLKPSINYLIMILFGIAGAE